MEVYINLSEPAPPPEDNVQGGPEMPTKDSGEELKWTLEEIMAKLP